MSSTNQSNTSTSSNLNYDPSSLATYQNLTGGGGKVLSDYINNPFGNAFYGLGQGQSQKGAAAAGNNSQQAMQSQIKTGGLNGRAGAGFNAAQSARIGRSNLGIMSQANQGNVMQALQRQLTATGMGMSFNPLLKGETGSSNTTQTTSGLGTWLPQLLGAAAGAAGGFATGGASKLFGGNPVGSTASAFSMPSSSFGSMGNIMAGAGGSMPNLAQNPWMFGGQGGF